MTNRKYFLAMVIGVVLWLGETAAFGWNAKPETALESVFDYIALIIIMYGIIGDLISNVEIHKNYYKYKETNIKTRNVEIKGANPKVDYNFGTTAEETRDLLKGKSDGGK